ncbi:DUF1476 domain-containing protein [Metarhizobium album]|uniref:DUF1476 domain-containing protein n=1 Tax=Metarhizobium album TaxID=2182425 RepID=A0A2U2DX70_9HYPH|nr:ATPase inhibitor subunit zeta [Rhizobium album]OJU04981.1 MAG: hypothetical protein BGN83_06135 [Rhizobium sp. 63-7]PWE57925.1 DUF1476 domain-containing protein [Rhizobium album]
MTALLKRARALEDKFAHDQEFMFKAQARRNALIGLWAAATLRRHDAQAYARELTTADIADPDGVFARLRRDFDAAGVEVLDDEIRCRMTSMLKDVANDMYEGR